MKTPKEELADEVYRILRGIGAVIENDHFIYQSGRHGSVYVSHRDIYINPHVVSRLAFWLTEYCYPVCKDKVDIVLSPTNGSVALSQWLAYYLGQLNERRVLALWAEKGQSVVGRRQELVLPAVFKKYVEGKNVLVVDDVVTTGDTFGQLIKLCRSLGAKVIAGACLWNRKRIAEGDCSEVSLISLVEEKLEDWDEKGCLLCKEAIPVNTDYGYGAEFLTELKELDKLSYDTGGEG